MKKQKFLLLLIFLLSAQLVHAQFYVGAEFGVGSLFYVYKYTKLEWESEIQSEGLRVKPVRWNVNPYFGVSDKEGNFFIQAEVPIDFGTFGDGNSVKAVSPEVHFNFALFNQTSFWQPFVGIGAGYGLLLQDSPDLPPEYEGFLMSVNGGVFWNVPNTGLTFTTDAKLRWHLLGDKFSWGAGAGLRHTFGSSRSASASASILDTTWGLFYLGAEFGTGSLFAGTQDSGGFWLLKGKPLRWSASPYLGVSDEDGRFFIQAEVPVEFGTFTETPQVKSVSPELHFNFAFIDDFHAVQPFVGLGAGYTFLLQESQSLLPEPKGFLLSANAGLFWNVPNTGLTFTTDAKLRWHYNGNALSWGAGAGLRYTFGSWRSSSASYTTWGLFYLGSEFGTGSLFAGTQDSGGFGLLKGKPLRWNVNPYLGVSDDDGRFFIQAEVPVEFGTFTETPQVKAVSPELHFNFALLDDMHVVQPFVGLGAGYTFRLQDTSLLPEPEGFLLSANAGLFWNVPNTGLTFTTDAKLRWHYNGNALSWDAGAGLRYTFGSWRSHKSRASSYSYNTSNSYDYNYTPPAKTSYTTSPSFAEATQYRTGKPEPAMTALKNDSSAENLRRTNPESYVRRVVQEINKHAKNDFEKAKMAHDIVAIIVAYDWPAFQSGNCPSQNGYDVLRRGVAVCEGYSNAYKAICDALGLPCEKVHGYARGAGASLLNETDETQTNHAWNIVKIKGNYYLVDCTWDAGYVNGYSYVPDYKTEWLFTKPEHFIYTHFAEDKNQQLLAKPISFKQFSELPNLSPKFFDASNSVSSNLKKINYCNENFSLPLDLKSGYKMSFSIKRFDDSSIAGKYDLVKSSSNYEEALFSLPKTGMYSVTVFYWQDGTGKYCGEFFINSSIKR